MKRSLLAITLFYLAIQPHSVRSDSLFQRVKSFVTRNNKKSDGLLDDIPNSKLTSGEEIPLVGLGVGNMIPAVIPAIVGHALQSDKKIRLFDTSNASKNEKLLAQGIVEGIENIEKSSDDEKVEVHVVTKVWYTHLGFERTILAVNESIEALKPALEHPNVKLQLHVMINWPRCYDGIPWMNCEQEENDLPEEVRQAGPAPHLDKSNAWKGSWKALETLFKDKESPVKSIGVSNFQLRELETLTRMASVQPHMVETNMWSLLYDPLLIDFCHKRSIHLTAFHLMEGIVRKAEEAPFAYHHLLVVANELSKDMKANGDLVDNEELTAAQVVLAWLVQHSVSVIPRTTDLAHLRENSAVSLAKIPSMTDAQVQKVAHSVEALISGEDVPEDAFLKLTFHAKTKDIYLYWHDHEYGGEIQVAKILKGTTFEESTHPGHIFRIYESEDKQNMEVFTVEGNYGDHRNIEL